MELPEVPSVLRAVCSTQAEKYWGGLGSSLGAERLSPFLVVEGWGNRRNTSVEVSVTLL